MAQAMTYAFIDTNVLLHYTFFKDVDWAKEIGVPEVVLVFAPVVLAEIDRHQFAGSRREKKRAQAVVKALDELELGSAPVALRDGAWALTLAYEPDSETYARWQLNHEVQDDRLLAALLAFREGAGAGHRVLVLTADTGLRRAKAPARQVETFKPADRLRSPDEPDEVEKDLASTRRELAAIKSAMPDMTVTFGGEKLLEFPFAAILPMQYDMRTRLLKEWRERNPRITAPGAIEIPGMGSFHTALAGFTEPSPSEADAHNSEVEQAYKRFGKYLDSWRDWVAGNFRTVRLDLVLENSGTAPAEDVDLVVWTEAKGVFRAKRPKPPSQPSVPKWRSRFDRPFEPLVRLPIMDSFRNFRDSAAEIEGPEIDEGDPTSAEFKVRRVKHLVPCQLPVVFFTFNGDEDVKSFTITFTLGAANMRERKTGSLHVKVIPGEPKPLPEPIDHDDSWPDDFADEDGTE